MSDEPAPETEPLHDEAPRKGTGAARRRTVVTAAAAAVSSLTLEACSAPPPASLSTRPRAGIQPTATATPDDTAHPGSPSRPSGPSPSALGSTGPDIQTGPPGPPRVALTFHGAGAGDLALRVLDVARAHGALLTVFAVGTWLEANPAIGRAILEDGHELGNHTYSHQPMRRLTAAQAHLEVSRGAAAVASVRGSAGLLFRPSGTQLSTATIRAAARAAGYHRCVSYDVDPQDYLDPGASAVRERTLAAARTGSIVSLHLGHPGTVAALPGILDGLQQR
ncbi:MAG: polysaccharide deacetylase family protein, partial [Terrabacter sp.]